MILDHVAYGPGLVVVARSPLDPQLFGNHNPDVLDAIPIPDRLEEGIGEPEDQEVLDCLLAQVVVDPVDLRFIKVAVEQTIEVLS